ncbi:MAG: VOC family protein [Pseudomonadales bacterium]
MQLHWSHAAIYVHDLERMLAFYSTILGFQVTDRGPLGDGAPEIVFLSQDPDEHHQLAMIHGRQEVAPSNSAHHFSFRTGAFADIRALHEQLREREGIKVLPLSHGNTLSLYFNDPEGNGIEVFWDTPWHVAQPQGEPWDISMDEAQALAWVVETFSSAPGFQPRDDYYAQRRLSVAAATQAVP